MSVLVIGGGPAGLRAAEVAVSGGASVTVCDAQPSVGRKFLVAGRGGLNLTHGEPVENFPMRYGAEEERWRKLLAEFGPAELRAWARDLGYETHVGTSGRVFPRGQKAAGLLRAWVRRLRANGARFDMNSRLVRLVATSNGIWRAEFAEGPAREAERVILALGGASWPETGSTGAWPGILAEHGVICAPWQPANCGWEVDWPNELLARAEGLPLKNLQVQAGGESVSGELLITRHGLEGGAIYRLGRALRAMSAPQLRIDLKPQLTVETMLTRIEAQPAKEWFRALKVSAAAMALLETMQPADCVDRGLLVRRLKNFVIPLRGPRPIAEAISSAGGIPWSEIDDTMMVRRMPGVFVAGEMIDWEAQTGGYLLQGCFSTANRAARAAFEDMRANPE